MRGRCKGCYRETVLKENGLCQKCWHKEHRIEMPKIEIRKTCIFCGWKRTWDAYKANWMCDKCNRCQFEHPDLEEDWKKWQEWLNAT